MSESGLPSGTVTFLFTDIEGSTRLWEEHPDAMRDALVRHDQLLREAIESHGGSVVKTTGDGFHAAFGIADAGVVAAVAAQRALDGEAWPLPAPLRVRMGLHTGAASIRDGDYFGSSLNRAARLMGVAHGGQIVCSQATADLARDTIAEGLTLADLGEHRLRDLSRPERVFQVCAPGLAGEFAALTSIDAFPGNLPLQVSSFVGRERELARVAAALEESRVVTLTGVGGVGKTRLALQVAADVLPRFREGAWLVELAAVRDPDGVVDACNALFGISARAGQTAEDVLLDFLGTKQLLLVVDNCEHVLDAIADLVDEIVTTCGRVTVLATSREGLALDGERLIAVPALGAPDADASVESIGATDAVQLFLDRAGAADDGFALSAENAGAVAQVCRRLDGIPLAIELAAARVTAMSPADLASALDRRFDVLAGGRRRAVKRQQTLRATIDWSYDLLDETHQQVLARLSVFAGGCTREAAEAVCTGPPIEARAVLGLLTDLVDRSLVVAERGGLDTRYRLLETIREYAEERLAERGETDEVRDRHARYYADYTLRCGRGMWSPEQLDWSARMVADSENALSGLAHALDCDDVDLAVDFVEGNGASFVQTGTVVLLPVEAVAAMPGVREHPGYPLILMAAAFDADRRGDPDRAHELADAALVAERSAAVDLPHEWDVSALYSTMRGFMAMSAGAWNEAATAFLDAADRHGRAGDDGWVVSSLVAAASSLCYAGRLTEAEPVATDALRLARDAGIPTLIHSALIALAQALSRTDPERARALLHEVAGEVLDHYAEVTQLTITGAMLGDWAMTARFAVPSIQHLHWMNQLPYLAGVLTVVARALVVSNPEAAATIQGAAGHLGTVAAQSSVGGSTPTGGAAGSLFLDARREATKLLTDTLGAERLRELRDQGAAMDTDDAVAYTLAGLDAFLANTN